MGPYMRKKNPWDAEGTLESQLPWLARLGAEGDSGARSLLNDYMFDAFHSPQGVTEDALPGLSMAAPWSFDAREAIKDYFSEKFRR